ncbi:MAG: histidine--tRNA ligase [Thaumarchaeota archaeon]|nr:histidine--tRNA ligase [Nitrososphaerota archaeon]
MTITVDLSLPRGIRDIDPDEFDLHHRIRTAFDELVRAYNFRSMEPAPLETLSVLRAKSGEQVDEQIYHFKDKGGRDIGLRFDLTVGMTRYVAGKKGLRPPIKLASYGGVFRYDEPQHARYRWFYQWDIEIFGDPTIDSDAEVMDLSYNLFKKLGLSEVILHVGDRRVVEEYITKTLRVSSQEKTIEMMRALDKVGKKTDEELIREYETKGVRRDEMSGLLEFGRTTGSPDKVLTRLEETGLGSAQGLGELRDALRQRGVANVQYNLSIVRGLDYYTAIVFEVKDGARPDLGSLCGGGRYDVLPKIFGRPELSATGAAGGVERIALSMSPRPREARSVYVAYTEPLLMEQALEALAKLRATGIRSEVGPRAKGLRKQLEDASATGFRWVLIIGRKELDSGSYLLRDLEERTETLVPSGEFLSYIGAR